MFCLRITEKELNRLLLLLSTTVIVRLAAIRFATQAVSYINVTGKIGKYNQLLLVKSGKRLYRCAQ